MEVEDPDQETLMGRYPHSPGAVLASEVILGVVGGHDVGRVNQRQLSVVTLSQQLHHHLTAHLIMAIAASVDSLGVDTGVDDSHQASCDWSIGSILGSDWLITVYYSPPQTSLSATSSRRLNLQSSPRL